MRTSRLAAGALCALGLLTGFAHGSVTYYLSITNTPGTPPNSPPYATLTLDSVTVGSVAGVRFTVDSLSPDYYLDQAYFNFAVPGETVRLDSWSFAAPAPSLATNRNADGFGKFDYEFDTNHPADFSLTTYSFVVVAQNAGIDVSSTLSDFIAVSEGNNGGYTFAGHIKTTNNSSYIVGDGSGTGQVPEPASMALLGLGLLATASRRRARVH